MEAKASVKFVRMSPRKVKIVCDLIRDKDVATAAAILYWGYQCLFSGWA